MRARLSYLITTLLIIFLLFLSIPLITGFVFKKNYQKTLAAIAADSKVNLTVAYYRMGWFKSYAKIVVEPRQKAIVGQFQSEMVPAIVGGLTIEQTITHGPFLHDSVMGWNFAIANIQSSFRSDALAMLMGTNIFLVMNTKVGFKDNYASHMQLMPISADFDQYKLTWQGMTGVSQFHIKDQRVQLVQSDMTVGAVNVDGPKLLIKTSGWAYKDKIARESFGLWQGTESLSLPLFSVASDVENLFEANNANLAMSFGSNQNNTYSTDIKVDAKTINSANISMGPLSLTLSLKNMDGKVLSQLLNTLPRNTAQYEALLPHLWTQSSAVNLDFNVANAAGNATAKLEMTWPAIASLQDIYMKANYVLTIRIAAPFLEQILAFMDKKDAEYYLKNPPAPAIQTPSAPASVSPDFSALMSQKKITPVAAEQLTSMQQLHISFEVYAATIDGLVNRKQISEDASAQLKAAYQANEAASSSTTTDMPKETPRIKPSEYFKQQILENIKKGYILEQDGYYVIHLVSQQGIMKVNGIDFNPAIDIQLNMPQDKQHVMTSPPSPAASLPPVAPVQP